MSTKKAGPATQDMSKGFLPKEGYGSVKTGKDSGRTHTGSVASPSSLKSGTKEGRGGTTANVSSRKTGNSGGGYAAPLGKK